MKAILLRYLQRGREAVVWKLDGLSEYDARRPLVATGTNLLGLVKHLTYVEAGYFGSCFGRPFSEPLPEWGDDAEPNADMFARADEARPDIVERYQRACAHADETIAANSLEDTGYVPWWSSSPSGDRPTLHWLLVHTAVETHRHAGHADVVRELIDDAAGISPDWSNLPEVDAGYWPAYRARLEQIARNA
jgi:hypothetical protein